jgi:hypothetical protein
VNQPFTVRLHSRKEQIWQRLVHEEKVVVAMSEHDGSRVLLRPRLEVSEECLESARAPLRI